MEKKVPFRIGIVGGGPCGLFVFKRLAESGRKDIAVHIFERNGRLGCGMPYSKDGSGEEHITNVSGNEIPEIVTPISEWVKTVPEETLDRFGIDPIRFNEYKVLPRLFFGLYLSGQFDLLLEMAKNDGIGTIVHLDCNVTDITENPGEKNVTVVAGYLCNIQLDAVFITSGHSWPRVHEGMVRGYYDSPYPPSKLALKIDHPVAIKGSSLTAVDAIRTLARHNGAFRRDGKGRAISYATSPGSEGFRMVMHSRNGLLPAVRFHLEDTHLRNGSLLTREEIEAHISGNNGFLSLDFIFDKDFKEIFREKDPGFYSLVRDMDMESFVAHTMGLRADKEPFGLLKEEYGEADRSIRGRKSVYWKELLGALSFAMNYPAKHFSAEDMVRLQTTLAPLISVIIAYIPQSSAEELLALHAAGVLGITAVGGDSHADPNPGGGAVYKYTEKNGNLSEIHYHTYIDCTGQPHLPIGGLPFKGLLEKSLSPARLRFRDKVNALENHTDENIEKDSGGNFYMRVPGVAINDSFQAIGLSGTGNERLYILAVPYIGGFNPDYSGLDFCEEASKRAVGALLAAL